VWGRLGDADQNGQGAVAGVIANAGRVTGSGAGLPARRQSGAGPGGSLSDHRVLVGAQAICHGVKGRIAGIADRY